MIRNYLKGTEGDMINTIMAATAFNMMKKLRKIRESVLFVLNQLLGYWTGICLTPVRY
jgi:transposase, IS5 family